MKIVKQEAFLDLPTGTIYCRSSDSRNPGTWMFGALYVKGETINSFTWNRRDLCSIGEPGQPRGIPPSDLAKGATRIREAGHTPLVQSVMDKIRIMTQTGNSEPVNEIYIEDMAFDDELFLIFENEDLFELIELAEAAIKLRNR